ncbi:hypothetical protein [Endozoicomonas sp. GU-1]|uniref:hypothetical protein n=1 Tax=Endozoicomonas sp. GU-1 TaxID=3009078 RepID=UPI0022B3C54C|nr:hypothetical protein [Endozoicomonas sp. GU-1]WBA80109.1 hypothetical protein O2T12_17365 [Endozoicomonas sp. GU-1]WBA87686.1 hypothetical protein O3276_06600 [Endozoicomonas sp. GU-1]
MSVQIVDTPFPAYHNQSDIPNLSPDPIILLSEYGIKPLAPSDTEESFGTDTPDRSKPVSDQYTLANSGDKSIKYTLPSTPDIPFTQQIFLPMCQPETSEATQAYHLNPVYLLINPPDDVSEPQMSPPATVITPLNLNQTSSDNIQAKKMVDAPPSIMKRQSDPTSLEKKRKRQREQKRERYQNDPEFAERQRQRMRERIKSPGYLMRQQERLRERRKNPAYAKRQNKLRSERQKARYQNDPAFAEREKKRSREQRIQRRKKSGN